MDEWIKQGHPEGVRTEQVLDYDMFDGFPLCTSHYPQFEMEVIEKKDGHMILYDEEGALLMARIDAQGSGFVTRKWLKFPVASKDDFIKMTRERYNPEDKGRRGDDFEEAVARTETSQRPFLFGIQGFYWTMRQWMGFEGLSVAFYDMPELIDEMMDFVLDFNVRLIRANLSNVRVDTLMINEDMAYKTAAMVSPKVVKEKFLPRYRELIQEAKRLGSETVVIDCDGHISELIPLWIDAGIDGTLPVEIAAEQSLLDYARRYPDFVFLGGLDKRVLSRTKKEVEAEVVPKATELYARGGWIPAVDHAVPADAKWENFQYMIALLKQNWPV